MLDNPQENASERYIIFASHLPTNTVTRQLFKLNISVKGLTGSWEGEQEQSYIINAKHWATLRQLGIVRNQKCVLFLGAVEPSNQLRPTVIHNLRFDPSMQGPEFICWLWQVDQETAERSPGWTRDINGQYYVASVLNPCTRQGTASETSSTGG